MSDPAAATISSVNRIAREAMKLLAAERLPVDPVNYAAAYRRAQRAMGEGELQAHGAEDVLAEIAEAIAEGQQERQITAAVREGRWTVVSRLVKEALKRDTPKASAATGEIATVFARVLQQLEIHHPGITLSKKRDGLRRALAPRSEPVTELTSRLIRLTDSWSATAAEPPSANLTRSQILADTDDDSSEQPGLPAAPHSLTASLAMAQRDTLAASALEAAQQERADFQRSRRTPLSTEDYTAARMRTLLLLLIENIADLTPDARAMRMQLDAIERVLAPVLNEQKLDEAERVLRSMIIRQGTINHGVEEARLAAKEMAASLIERLDALSASAGAYQGRVQDITVRISAAENLTQLSHVVTELLGDTKLMASDMMRARDDLNAERARAKALETRAKLLEDQLAEASALVRTDPLTTILNRRGFEESYALVLRQNDARRSNCVALLDIDDFKRVNEAFGHAAGDAALKYVADVMREVTRPSDAVGRYGGEEFVILFPETDLATAEGIMTKIQRELTRRVFLEKNSRVLITFSCGLTSLRAGESLDEVLARADVALHSAKRNGKNKVVLVLEDASVDLSRT